jgi:hypothetical protein
MMLTLPTVALPAALALLATLLTAATAGRQTDAAYPVRRTTAEVAALVAADVEAWAPAAPAVWGTAPWPTTFRALASAEALWVRFDAVDDSAWHTFKQRDDPLWEEEVVEIFIDPDGDGRNYVEVEINPANVLCDLLVAQGAPNLRADIDWNFPGIETTVRPLHDAAGTVIGWTAIARLPWAGFAALPDTAVTLPPLPGDRWSFNVFRIKRPDGPREPRRRVILDAWSPVPGGSFHVPEVFRAMEFE